MSVQDLLQETQIPQKELVRALQSLALGKPQQRVLIQLHRRKDSSVRDFGEWTFCFTTFNLVPLCMYTSGCTCVV